MTQEFSNTLVEFMKAECLRRKLSFIIEGTMRMYNVIESTAKQARDNGLSSTGSLVHKGDEYRFWNTVQANSSAAAIVRILRPKMANTPQASLKPERNQYRLFTMYYRFLHAVCLNRV